MIPHTDTSDYLLTLPYVNYKLLKFDSQSRIKAKPQLRVVDQEEVKVRLGDKVPIPTTSFVPYNTGGPAQQPITSYQLQDIGININITPRLHHDGLITLEMKFELTFITSPGDGRVPPTIGNRSVETIIKLRDNETSILAGLLRDTERKSIRGFPFVSGVPLLKDIFSGNKNELDQTDIILTLTPRIIRFPDIDEEDLEFIWAGTAQRPELKKPAPELRLKEDEKAEKKSDRGR
jgi:general secretion pathway protein D